MSDYSIMLRRVFLKQPSLPIQNIREAGITDTQQPQIMVETVTEMDRDLWERILHIDEAAFGPESLNKWSLPLFLHYGGLFIARYNGEPVGAAELIRDWHDPALVYLYGYAVTPEFRGMGIGTTLLGFILKVLPRAGFRRLQLTVHPENQLALHIYRDKFGMRAVEFIRNYYGPGEDRWLLEWSWDE
jgi:ribosomal protein S18 acetylase RimI-like enzyme